MPPKGSKKVKAHFRKARQPKHPGGSQAVIIRKTRTTSVTTTTTSRKRKPK